MPYGKLVLKFYSKIENYAAAQSILIQHGLSLLITLNQIFSKIPLLFNCGIQDLKFSVENKYINWGDQLDWHNLAN